jgi:hypothetical protein
MKSQLESNDTRTSGLDSRGRSGTSHVPASARPTERSIPAGAECQRPRPRRPRLRKHGRREGLFVLDGPRPGLEVCAPSAGPPVARPAALREFGP